MRTNVAVTASFIACALAAASCGGGSTPSAPSALTPPPVAGGTGTVRTLDDPPATPGPAPVPDPATPPPAPDPAPPAPAPSPMTVVINIIGYIGSSAFMPNPTTANAGDQIVFTNTDTRMHHIVIDNGPDLGEVQPGQSSAPVALATPTATFHCTIHPTMIGAINAELAPPPYQPPPQDDYSGYYRQY